MAAARTERDYALAENRAARAAVRGIDGTRRALSSTRAAASDASAMFAAQRQAIEGRLEELDRAGGDNWLLWIGRPVRETLPMALLILAIAIFGPALIKALMYFAVAPIAARRPAIRLVPSDRGAVSDQGGPSAASQRVPLDSDLVMLVLPEAVQSTPHDAGKSDEMAAQLVDAAQQPRLGDGGASPDQVKSAGFRPAILDGGSAGGDCDGGDRSLARRLSCARARCAESLSRLAILYGSAVTGGSATSRLG